MGRQSRHGHQGTINRARPNDHFYRVADHEVDALMVRDVSTVNDQVRGLCIREQPEPNAAHRRIPGRVVHWPLVVMALVARARSMAAPVHLPWRTLPLDPARTHDNEDRVLD